MKTARSSDSGCSVRRNLAFLFAVIICLLAASIAVGRALPGGQIAYSYTDRLGQDTRAYLVDTRHRLHFPLRQNREAVSVGRWVSQDVLLVWFKRLGDYDRPALFTIGQGWTYEVNCIAIGCARPSPPPVTLPPWITDGEIGPLLSPDGQQVAFMRRVGNTYALRLYVGDTAGAVARLTRGVFNLRYIWRP